MQKNKNTNDILSERGKTHGGFEIQARRCQELKELVLINDPVLRESAHMIFCKLSRAVAGDEYEIDHWRDIAGYAELAARYIEDME